MRTACLALAVVALSRAADFHSGQAARAVIGQSSFRHAIRASMRTPFPLLMANSMQPRPTGC